MYSHLVKEYLKTKEIKKIPMSNLKKHRVDTWGKPYYLQGKSKVSTYSTSKTDTEYK
jgi:hypothetical protein